MNQAEQDKNKPPSPQLRTNQVTIFPYHRKGTQGDGEQGQPSNNCPTQTGSQQRAGEAQQHQKIGQQPLPTPSFHRTILPGSLRQQVPDLLHLRLKHGLH